MPVPASARRPAYAAYISLALLFAFSVSNQIRTLPEGLGYLLHGAEHVHDPFEIDGPDLPLILLQPEARAAGIRDGDTMAGVGARPLRDFPDYYSILQRARPGEKLSAEVQSSAPGGAVRQYVSIELRPAFPAGPKASDWLAFAVAGVATPLLCIGSGLLGRAGAHPRHTGLAAARAAAEFRRDVRRQQQRLRGPLWQGRHLAAGLRHLSCPSCESGAVSPHALCRVVSRAARARSQNPMGEVARGCPPGLQSRHGCRDLCVVPASPRDGA
jgi:hypothetical protein